MVAGQKAEALARLDRRARQDDAPYALGRERLDGHGHGQVGLAGAGRPDGEGDRVGADGIDVALLVDRARSHLTAAMTPDDVAVHLGGLAVGADGDVHRATRR